MSGASNESFRVGLSHYPGKDVLEPLCGCCLLENIPESGRDFILECHTESRMHAFLHLARPRNAAADCVSKVWVKNNADRFARNDFLLRAELTTRF